MAEEVCMKEVCGSGYEHNAAKFPYTAEYWKTPLEDATAFTFKVHPAYSLTACTIFRMQVYSWPFLLLPAS